MLNKWQKIAQQYDPAKRIPRQRLLVFTVLLLLSILPVVRGADATGAVGNGENIMPDDSGSKKTAIILETDLCTDVDDAGALAMLHALADRGECSILGICYNACHPHGAGAITAINCYYGRGDIPIGVYKEKHPDTTDPSAYCEALHTGFAPDAKLTEDMPDALEVYRTVLSDAEDRS